MPQHEGQQNIGSPNDLLLCLPSAVMETVKGRATACVISASGYLARISASIRFRLFMTHPPVGQVLMQIFFGADIGGSLGWIHNLAGED